MKIVSYAVLAGLLAFPHTSFARASDAAFEDVQDSADYRLIKLQRELYELSQRGDAIGKKIENVEKDYKDFETAAKEETPLTTETEDVISETPETKITEEKTSAPKTEVIPEEVPLPEPTIKKYNPLPAKTDKNSGGRRPFIRSDVSTEGEKVYFARVSESEAFGFADEATTTEETSSDGNYSGFNDNNVYVFPDAYAVNCSLHANDAAENGKIVECIEGMLKDKSVSNQSAKDQAVEVLNAGMYQETKEAVSSGARNANIAGNFEEQTLDKLKEESSKSTDERSDFQSLTLTDMEAVKTKYRLIEVYASMLKFQALKAMIDFEVNSQELTNIDKES